MDFILQQFINGLTVGGIYALIALGYTMVYGVLKLINFAHGDLCILGAFIGLTSLTTGVFGGLSTPVLLALAFIIAMIAVAVTGTLLDQLAYKPLRRAHRLSPVVSALGASMLIARVVHSSGSASNSSPGITRATSWAVACAA